MASLIDEYARDFEGRKSAVLNDINRALERMGNIDKEAKRAIAAVDRDGMNKVIKDAGELKYKTNDVAECARLVALSEPLFCKMELDAAIASKVFFSGLWGFQFYSSYTTLFF